MVMSESPIHGRRANLAAPPSSLPLVVDLDGTLLRSDLLVEAGMMFLKEHPGRFWQPMVWITSGKAALKARLAEQVDLDVSHHPFYDEVIEMINSAKKEGRRIILATASHEKWARQVADQLGLFDEVLATDEARNLSAESKRDELLDRFGERNFDYVGNSHDDLPILAVARKGYLVNPQPGLRRKVQRLATPVEIVVDRNGSARTWFKALRIHQWLKNLLIFVPLLAAHKITEPQLVIIGVFAFLFFGLVASSVYLLNDLLDLSDDRKHPKKCQRPFASGTLSVKVGLAVVPLLLLVAFAGSLVFLPWGFTVVLAAYYLLTLAYSIDLKRRMMIDVMVLAALYTMRVIAGGAAFGLELTFWILALSLFIFLSLAMVKRYAELHSAAERGQVGQTPGRGYWPDDMGMVAVLGAVSGYIAVLVLALYIHDTATATLYSNAEWIWLAVPLLLFWVSRIWMITHRGDMHEDPLVFAVRDRVSLGVGMLFLLVFWVAI
jgi:4-hydroxybenzoate polyprenyltransferase